MPIPTRPLSLRGPQPAQRRKTGGQDTVSSSTARPVSSTSSGPNRAAPTSIASTKSSSHVSGPSDSETPAGAGVSIPSRRSLLPQRNHPSVAPSGGPAERTVAPQETQSTRLRNANLGLTRRGSVGSAVKRTAEPKVGGNNDSQQASGEQSASGRTKPARVSVTRLDRSASLRQPGTSRTVPGAPVHVRHRSQVSGSVTESASAIKRADKSTVGLQPHQAPQVAPKHTKQTKPQFNTYQQQYSPKKLAAKPSIVGLSAISADTNVAAPLPAHIPPLQVELLQLHLLHSQALGASRKWENNADAKCRKLHESVMATYRSVISAERSIQRSRNAAAIEQFAADIKASNSRYDFPTQIQMLSKVIQEVSNLNGPEDSRYNVTVREFEEWYTNVLQIKQTRSDMSETENFSSIEMGLQFIDPLNDEWRNRVASLMTNLELCSREIDCLDIGATVPKASIYDASALARAVKGHKILIQSMIEELETMARTEAKVIKMERLLVKRQVESIQADRASNTMPESNIPAWQR